jgi:hypothetical protein
LATLPQKLVVSQMFEKRDWQPNIFANQFELIEYFDNTKEQSNDCSFVLHFV